VATSAPFAIACCELCSKRLGEEQRRDVQRLADELLGEGLDTSTVGNILVPLRVIYRRAIEDGDLAVNPTGHLRLAVVRGRRERIASPEDAKLLLAALPDRDRALWATALHAGLRRGELMGLCWKDVDLATGVIHVERAYDEKDRVYIEPKSQAGRRTVPIVVAGHASTQTTYELYRKLMPGPVAEAAAVVNAYLDRADTAARLAQIEDDA
jgi:integrase